MRELKNEEVETALRYYYASAGNDSVINSGRLRPPIHLLTESIKTITAAVVISTVSEVLM